MPALLGLLLSTILSTAAVKGATALGSRVLGGKALGEVLKAAASKSPALMSAASKVAGSGAGQAASKVLNASTKGGTSLKSVSSGLGREAGNNLMYMGAHLATLPLIPDAIHPYGGGGDNDSNLATEMQYRITNHQGVQNENALGLQQMNAATMQTQLAELLRNQPRLGRIL